MTVRRIDDIERESRDEKKENLKKEIAKDIRDITDIFQGNLQRLEKSNVKKIPLWAKAFNFIWIVTLFLLAGTLFLGCIWALKFLIKSLFMGG